MGLLDTRRAKVSLASLVVGGFVLALLVILGVFVKTMLHKMMTERLKYDYPPGYSKNPDLQWCYKRGEGEGKFNDEYYMWNLTNVDEVINGGNAVYNLVGPYVFANWTCRFGWKVEKGVLSYNEMSYGYHFLESQSVGSQYDKITNVNPGYLGLMKATGSENAVTTLMVGGALNTLITTLQKPDTIQKIQGFGAPQVLATINSQVTTSFAAGYSLRVLGNVITATTAVTGDVLATYSAIFNDPSMIVPTAMNFQGFAYFVNNTLKAPSVGALSNTSMTALITDWSAGGTGMGLIVFAKTFQASPAAIVAKYAITPDQAGRLAAYVGGYLMNPQSFNAAAVTGMVYAQWANLTTLNGSRVDMNPPRGFYGWEVGTATGITPDVVARLFDPTNQYSFTSLAGAQFWFGFVQNQVPASTVLGIYPTLSPAQLALLGPWWYSFFVNVVPPLMLTKFNISSWDDFAYVQWGQLVLGQSIGPLQNLTYLPEIAAFNASAYGKDQSCVKYTLEEAKYLLNGTNGLRVPQNAAFFFGIANTKNYNATKSLWGIDADKTDCLLLYLTNVLRNQAVMPVLNGAVHSGGSGLFVTRTVNEWLFNAKDPLLGLLGQPNSVAVVGNVTRSYEEAKNVFPPQQLRVYTGDNSLFWALQVPNAGDPVHGFWADDITVSGFNGTQFMPYDWVKKSENAEHLHIWHPKVMRPINLKYYGMTDFGGLKVAYMSFAPDTLASASTFPANSVYFAQYSGLINQSHFPTTKGLPLFISLPKFNMADPAVTQNLTMIDNIFAPIEADPVSAKSRHRYMPFVMTEPYTGQTVWANVPIQGNFKYGPTDIFFPKVKPNFAPIFWSAVGDKGKQSDLDKAKKALYGTRAIWKALIGVGAGLGGILLVLGTNGLMKNKNQYKKTRADEKLQNDRL